MINNTFRIHTESAVGGLGNFEVKHLFDKTPDNLETVAIVTVEPGECIGYHIHDCDNELYYILCGKAEYDDNGSVSVIGEGTSTCTLVGEGHSIKNIGTDTLRFVAVIVK